jgi:hypothetical protein
MSKGLTVALMTVAVAVLAVNAMALAPTIGSVPSPIVGDENSPTYPNLFVFPDAIDLRLYGEDPTGDLTPGEIIWSYEASIYTINGVPSMGGGDDPADPGATSKAISAGVQNGEDDPDGNAYTVTIRNANLSPIGGPNTDPGGAGYVLSETELVTLYASDGTTYSSATVWFYTDNDGNDRFSGEGEHVIDNDFNGSTNGWTSFDMGSDDLSHSTDGDTALCMTVGLTGANAGGWVSPEGILNLVKNSVWKFVMVVNSSQASAGAVPFWDLAVDNADTSDPFDHLQLYGLNYFFQDNAG